MKPSHNPTYDKKVYTEYRDGLSKALMYRLSKTIKEDTKQTDFLLDISKSIDVKEIMENLPTNYLDNIDGFPKLIMTIVSYYYKNKYI